MAASRAWRAARWAVAVAPLAFVLIAAPPAGAHAIVDETEPAIDEIVPASPSRVLIRFNEPVEIAFGAVRVFDSDARRVDDGEAEHVPGDSRAVQVGLDGGLPEGTYTVTWRVVSADGHAIDEAFVFHVGAPGERPEGIATELLAGETGAGRLEGALAGVARFLTFAGLLLLTGCVAFALALRLDEAFRARWHRLLLAGWLAALAGTVGTYVLHASLAGDLPLGDALTWSAWEEVARTRYGRAALARMALLVGAGVAAWTLRRRLPGRWFGAPAVVVVVGLTFTLSWSGHAGSTSPTALNVAADVLHVLAAGVWLGGLVVLLAGPPSADATVRFSALATGAVTALVATGVLRSWVEVRSFDAVTESYGLVLVAKVALVLPMVALGAVNNRWLVPKVREAAESMGRLRRLVAAEVGLGVAVVVVTAVLVNLAPARVSANVDGPFMADVALGEYELDVLVDPNEVGENEVHLTATTATGAAAEVEAMQVLFSLPEEDIGPLVGEGVRLARGHFVVQGRQLSVAGRWVLEVVARTGRFEEERARVSVDVR